MVVMPFGESRWHLPRSASVDEQVTESRIAIRQPPRDLHVRDGHSLRCLRREKAHLPEHYVRFLRSATFPRGQRTAAIADLLQLQCRDPTVGYPPFACRVFTSMVGSASAFGSSPDTAFAPPSSGTRHCLIWFG